MPPDARPSVTRDAPPANRARGWRRFLRRNPTICFGAGVIALMAVVAMAAPFIAGDPLDVDPGRRLQPPSRHFRFGTDNLGRDVFALTVYGARVSLLVGFSVALGAAAGGLAIGVVVGYSRRLDRTVMRVMDGVMAIPAFLLAIALVALTRGGEGVVIVAIVIPEVPRAVRLVRSVVLRTREEAFVEAARAGGACVRRILWWHILPSTITPLIVQATYVCASAILAESGLSFLGAGIPPEIPSWGNLIATSRLFIGIAPWNIFFPGLCLALLVLAVNLLGDGLRDLLDPRLARRM